MSNLGTFQVGQRVKITATFTSETGALTDPTVCSWRIQHRDGTVDTYALVDMVKISLGVWYLLYTITANTPGRWWSRPRSTAGVIAADEDYFEVEASAFVTP